MASRASMHASTKDPRSRLSPLGLADWPVLASLLAVALGVRLFMMPDALSYDEAQHYLVAKSPLAGDFTREFRLRAHPPLAYLLMKPFVALGSSVYWVRMAQLLCGLATIVVVYRVLGRILHSQGAALLGSFLIAVAPIFVKQSIDARHYSLCLLLIWTTLWVWQRMRDSESAELRTGSKVRAHHLWLAGLQLLALFAEYSAVFAVVALSLVIYLPLVKREVMRGGWGEILRLMLPQAAVAATVLCLFVWHFEGAVPSYSHTEAAVYLGSEGTSGRSLADLFDIGAVLAFLWRQLGFFQNAILPGPLGLAVLFAPALAFAPWLQGDPRTRACRAIAIYAGVSLLLSMAASLLGLFPFGGRPRHNAALVPGIVLASYLTFALHLSAKTLPPFARRVAAGALAVIIVLGAMQGLRPGLALRETYQRNLQNLGVASYRKEPASIVTNWRGRSYASWWFLPDASPRQTSGDAREQFLDYDGVRVIETESPRLLGTHALREAKQSGEAWILLSHFREEDTEHLTSVVKQLQSWIEGNPDVELAFAGQASFFPPLVVFKLRATPDSG